MVIRSEGVAAACKAPAAGEQPRVASRRLFLPLSSVGRPAALLLTALHALEQQQDCANIGNSTARPALGRRRCPRSGGSVPAALVRLPPAHMCTVLRFILVFWVMVMRLVGMNS